MIEHILQFLQYDIMNMFSPNCNKSEYDDCSDECIEHEYPQRPFIVDGCQAAAVAKTLELTPDEDLYCMDNDSNCMPKEKQCSKQGLKKPSKTQSCLKASPKTSKAWGACGDANTPSSSKKCPPKSRDAEENEGKKQCPASTQRKSDCSNDFDEDDFMDDEEDEDNDDDCDCDKQKSSYDSISKKIISNFKAKYNSSPTPQMKYIEERATELFTMLNNDRQAKSTVRCSSSPNWWDLKPWQKLPFYWAALSNEILCEMPFDNFERFYGGNKKVSKKKARKLKGCAKTVWEALSCKQRMPFIMEAFIARVSTGKINICDEADIQKSLEELQKID